MKIKINPVLHILPLAAIILLSAARTGMEDPFIEMLKNKLEQYNEGLSIERAYLMTDRYVYKPGDNLWFKGYVTSTGDQIKSEDFFIRLLNSQGEEIIYHRYPISYDETSGHLTIPKSCIPGKYWLVAYTGWMKNRCPEEAFRKEILISKYFEKRFHVEMAFDKRTYFSHDTLSANLQIFDAAGKPVAETPFDFNLGSLKKTDFKGSGKTDIKGKAKIICIVPDAEDLIMLTVEIRSRKFSGDYSEIIPLVSSEPVITFHPEGNNMVHGVKQLMVVKSLNTDGLPMEVNGELTDYQGNVLQFISTKENGLAKFEYLPLQDTCYFIIVGRNGLKLKYNLPMPGRFNSSIRYTGTVSDSALFSITSSDPGRQKTYWTGIINGKMVYSRVFEFNRTGIVPIPLHDLPSGIMQVSVFDTLHNVLADRLIRIIAPTKSLKIKQDREVYHPRQRVSILVEYPDNLKNGNLALTVSLRSLAYNPFSPDFGNIVLADSCQTAWSRFNVFSDEELIATDYRIVFWEQILQSRSDLAGYIRYNGLTGKVVDKKENSSPHAKVHVTHFPNFRLYETQTDENGIFHIGFGSDIIDYKFLNIDAYDASGKISLNASVDYEYSKEIEKLVDVEMSKNRAQKISDLIKFGEPDLVYVLRYGPGKFRKSRSDNRKKYDPYRYTKYTDIMDIIQDIQPYRLVNNKFYFMDKSGYLDSSAMAETIIVINGSLRGNNAGALKGILPSDITNINISGSLLDVHKYTPLNFSHVIEITTIQSMYRYRQQHFQIGPGGLNTERSFNSPDYAVEGSSSADNRRTLYWNPKIMLYEGNSMLVTFYTSDVKGTFYGHITGIDNKGNPMETDFQFRVE